MKKIILLQFVLVSLVTLLVAEQTFPIIDTDQILCYDDFDEITPPDAGEPFYGQDAQNDGIQPLYQDNNDGTVLDLNSGLMWQQNLLENKLTYDEAVAGADTFNLAGYDDWRLPTIKESYSLIMFDGLDPSGWNGSIEDLIPFIDTNFFEFAYGDTLEGERIIDAQYASCTEYVSTTMFGDFTIFGVNFADGRIKGYGTVMPGPNGGDKKFEVRYVRLAEDYGINDFIDNEDNTVSDNSTNLMWCKNDSNEALNWEEALGWVEQKNQDNYLGYNDWRLPNIKELQSIVDYTRSPDFSNSAALDPVFNITSIINAGGETDYPYFWSSTTHANMANGGYASYVAFGRALGWMEEPPNSGNYQLLDVHGAGSQRSDPKQGDPGNFPYGHGPQGDVIRIYNYIRLVRDFTPTSSQNDIPETESIQLQQNSPNPFNPTTTISFSIPQESYVEFTIFNIKGQKVKTLVNSNLNKGNHSVIWNGDDELNEPVSSSIYLYKMNVDGKTEAVKKCLLLK